MAERTVLITGGGGGLGAAVTAAFVTAGWRVVLPVRPGATARGSGPAGTAPDGTLAGNDGPAQVDGPALGDGPAPDRIPSPGEVPAGSDPPTPGGVPTPGEPVVRVAADLTDPAQVARAVAVAGSEIAAPLRAVVNLVGGYAATGRVHETPIADFELMLALNLRPTYLVTQSALPYLIEAGGGSVVCVSSRAALAPFPGAAGYVTAKAAVLAFASAVAVEYRQSGVRCNTVVPSVIDTPANRAAQPGADHSRWVAPAEIAGVIRFLASDDSAPTSGAAIPVYGRA